MNKYESVIIINPNVDEEGIKSLISRFTDLINTDGKVDSVDKMGRKKLAYEINNFRDGFFVNLVLSLAEDKVADFKRQLKLNDSILRTMFLVTEKTVQEV